MPENDVSARVRDQHPPQHQKSVVRRDGVYFTAKPCYGLHDPWWVVQTMEGEAPPVSMRPDDEWWTLDEFIRVLSVPCPCRETVTA